MPQKEKLVQATLDGRAYIDANVLFRTPSERDSLRKLSSVAQRQIKREIEKQQHRPDVNR